MPEHAGYHEPTEWLDQATIERHRAIVSLMEELEAVDWYDQRIVASTDAALADILRHNRDEEMEHAAMTLEWLRRQVPEWDAVLRTYLFTDAPITAVEEVAEGGAGTGAPGPPPSPSGGLTIGSLRGASAR